MGISTTPTVIARLANQAYMQYNAAQAALKKKPFPDWVMFGKEMKALEASLGKLLEATKQSVKK